MEKTYLFKTYYISINLSINVQVDYNATQEN